MKKKNYHNVDRPGVYKIQNLITGHIYVGSSSRSIGDRVRRHTFDLRRGCHGNLLLQKSYDAHGEDSFEVEVLCYCSPNDSLNQEAEFIKFFNSNMPDRGFNRAPLPNYRFRFEQLKDTVIKKSNNKKAKALVLDGNSVSERGINKPVSLYDLRGHLIKNYPSCKALSEDTGWGRSSISTILTRRGLVLNSHIILYANDILTEDDIAVANRKCSRLCVYLYDLNMQFIKKFGTVKEAALFIGCCDAEVRMCCTGKRSRIRNYKTFYTEQL